MKWHIVRTCLLTCMITGDSPSCFLSFLYCTLPLNNTELVSFAKVVPFSSALIIMELLNLNFTELTALGKLSFSLTHCGRLTALLTLILYFHHYVNFEFFPLKHSIFPYPTWLIWPEQWNRSYSTQFQT